MCDEQQGEQFGKKRMNQGTGDRSEVTEKVKNTTGSRWKVESWEDLNRNDIIQFPF